MSSWLFIGPPLLSGIGQVTRRYTTLLRDAEYVEFSDTPSRERYDRGFAFVLPIPAQLAMVDALARRCTTMTYMTICETETVHPAYGMLEKYKTMYVASDFCKRVLERQFPATTWKVLRLFAAAPSRPEAPRLGTPYVFYTIGNIMDPRKNIVKLVEAFLRCKFPPGEAVLLLKATCRADVEWKVPGVQIINGLLTDAQMEQVHSLGHCYVNCSHSEGVGMGAVEAAMRNKPLIITDYGGLKEYVRTPHVVKCTVGPVGFDDFLFTKDMCWGHPSQEELIAAMRTCFAEKVHFAENGVVSTLMAEVASDLLSIQECEA
jgi:hypothetical protein